MLLSAPGARCPDVSDLYPGAGSVTYDALTAPMILLHPHHDLDTRTVHVEHFDSTLLDKLDFMASALDPTRGIALSANQVGLHDRMFIYQMEGDPTWSAMINPKIVESHGDWMYKEGCLSLPNHFWYIKRPKYITVDAFTKAGLRTRILADELMARMIMHEVDHLDGRMIMTRITRSERKVAERTFANNSGGK